MRRKEKTNDRLIAALLEAESVTDAAERAGMSRQHVHKLLRNPVFQRSLREARGQSHAHAMSRLCSLSSKAVSVLADALDGKDVSKTKFLSAKTILELSGRAIETDIEVRLGEIEEQLERMEVHG